MALEAEVKRKIRSLVDDVARYLEFCGNCSPEEYDFLQAVEDDRFGPIVKTEEQFDEVYSPRKSP